MSSWNPGGDIDLRGSVPAASTSKATKKKSKAAQDKADKEEVKRRSSKGEARVQVRLERAQQAHRRVPIQLVTSVGKPVGCLL